MGIKGIVNEFPSIEMDTLTLYLSSKIKNSFIVIL